MVRTDADDRIRAAREALAAAATALVHFTTGADGVEDYRDEFRSDVAEALTLVVRAQELIRR